MTINRKMMAGAAAIAALCLGGGFFLARAFDPHGSEVAQAEAKKHGEEPHEEGFVSLKPAEAAAAGVDLASVERGGGSDLLLPGRVALAANAQSSVGSPVDGSIIELHVAAGSSVRRGAPIASIRSADGGTSRAELDTAKAELDLAEATERRQTMLLEQGAVSRQQWEQTHASTLVAQAKFRSAEAAYAAIGSPNASGVTVVRSRIAGVVTRVTTSPGAVVDDGDEIAAIADMVHIELVFDAPPASIGLIRPGSKIEARWMDGAHVMGEVIGVGAGAAASGATVRAKALGAAPPPGTIISGRLVGGGGNVLTIPSEAVQTIEGASSVFVVEAEGFRAKPVVTGHTSAGRVEIVDGLEGGERIAGKGAFLLKAELGKGEAEHDH